MTPNPPDGTTRPAASEDHWQTARHIGHELNNVICAIQGYAEMMLEDVPANARPAADLLQIHEAAARAAELVSALRELAKRADPSLPPPTSD